LAAGNDPGEAKRDAKRVASTNAVNNFESIAREWHERNRHQWSAHYAFDVLSRLERHTFHKLGHRPIADITTTDILEVLRVVEESGALDTCQNAVK
jgi:integrase